MTAPREAYDRVRKFGGVTDLAARVKLRVTGADRVRYLNGQLTADVRKLAIGQSVAACVLTAKGKLCADVMLTAQADALLIDADESLTETLLPRLERYIIADDVAIEDVSATLPLAHLLPAADCENSAFSAEDLHSGGATATRRCGRTGFDFFQPAASVLEILKRQQSEIAALDSALFELLRIEAGIPRWGRELLPDTLPPEAGLDRTHVDYHKGCYIGQEVISRLKSVGHVNRQLTGFISTSDTPLPVGAALFAIGEETRALGVLTSSAWSFALEKSIALGYLRRGSPVGELLARPAEISSGNPTTVCVHELPFSS